MRWIRFNFKIKIMFQLYIYNFIGIYNYKYINMYDLNQNFNSSHDEIVGDETVSHKTFHLSLEIRLFKFRQCILISIPE